MNSQSHEPGDVSRSDSSSTPTIPGTSGLSISSSIAGQDLSNDKFIHAAPRMTFGERTVPSLGGIALLAKIGQGGMGAVYHGIHPRLRQEVAVKVLPFDLAERNPEAVQRFYREAQFAARVKSPNLVGVLDVNEEAGIFYLVMEYIDGITANSYLKTVKESGAAGLPEATALELCIAACTGLAAAHAKGIIHRDVKPDNILIPRSDQTRELCIQEAKLADLGLSRSEILDPASVTQSGICLGTPGFMSPEQANNSKTCGKPADVFSMGATLYALLAGRSPFIADTLFSILKATIDTPHPPILTLRSDISARTSELLDKCLEKFPGHRDVDAAALLASLRTCRAALTEGSQSAPAVTLEPGVSEIKDGPPSTVFAIAGVASDKSAPPPIAPETSHTSSAKSASPRAPAVVLNVAHPARARVWTWVVACVPFALLAAGGIYAWAFMNHAAPTARYAEAQPVAADTADVATAPDTKMAPHAKAVPGEHSKEAPAFKIQSFDAAKPESTLDLGGGVQLELVDVRAGEFKMGADDADAYENEKPVHTVRITKPFSIGKTPVTVAQFKRFAAATGFETDAERQGKGYVLADKTWRYVEGATWRTPGFDQDDNHPVVMVSWNDAQAFAKWAGSVSGRRVSLPTEAQWEYAARGPQALKYPWGNAWSGTKSNHADLSFKNSGAGDAAWPYSNVLDGFVFTSPVGRFKNASWCGALDMSGNVSQWCQDAFDAKFYSAEKTDDPVNAGQEPMRVQRGGSWSTHPRNCRGAYRGSAAPSERYPYYGFRVAVEH